MYHTARFATTLLPVLVPKHCRKKPRTPEQELVDLEIRSCGNSARHTLLHTSYTPPPMFCIRIASASQHDHWHRYRSIFEFSYLKACLHREAQIRDGVRIRWPLPGVCSRALGARAATIRLCGTSLHVYVCKYMYIRICMCIYTYVYTL